MEKMSGIGIAAIVIVILALAAAAVVIVTDDGQEWNVKVEVDGEGNVEPSSAVVEDGDSVEITMTPAEGWYLAEVLLDGVPVDVTGNVLTIADVHGDHSVKVVFAEIEAKLTVIPGENGTVSPVGESYHDHGEEVVVRITPDDGYVIGDVTVDGASVGSVNLYRVVMDSDHVIGVTFRAVSDGSAGLPADPVVDIDIDVQVMTTGYDFGTVEPSGKVRVAYGGSLTVTIALNPGFSLVSVMVDDEDMGASEEFTIENIVEDRSVSITVAHRMAVTYTVSSSASYGGTITPSGETVVGSGESLTFEMRPISGYRLSALTVDGVSVGTGLSTYTLENICRDMTVYAKFDRIPTPPTPGPTERVDIEVYLEGLSGTMVEEGALRTIGEGDYTPGPLSDNLFKMDNVIPGITQTAEIKVKNVGNVAVDVGLQLTNFSGKEKLAEAIDVSVNGTCCGSLKDLFNDPDWFEVISSGQSPGSEQTFSITLTLPEDAGNELMGKNLSFKLIIGACSAGGLH